VQTQSPRNAKIHLNKEEGTRLKRKVLVKRVKKRPKRASKSNSCWTPEGRTQ